jgi:hypothetical protein
MKIKNSGFIGYYYNAFTLLASTSLTSMFFLNADLMTAMLTKKSDHQTASLISDSNFGVLSPNTAIF